MKQFILSKSAFLGFLVIVAVLIGIQALSAYLIDYNTKVADDVICDVKDVGVSDGRVELQLDCSGQKVTTSSSSVVASYIKNPGLLTCAVYKMENTDCKPRGENKGE